MCIQSGFRCSEWSQSHPSKCLSLNTNITNSIDGSTTAFITEVLILKDKHKRPLVFSLNLGHSKVRYCSIRWYYQTNCYPTHMYIISVLFFGFWKDLYVSTSNLTHLLLFDMLGNLVAIYLQQAATKIYEITSKDDIARFFSHSIRVGVWVCHGEITRLY